MQNSEPVGKIEQLRKLKGWNGIKCSISRSSIIAEERQDQSKFEYIWHKWLEDKRGKHRRCEF